MLRRASFNYIRGYVRMVCTENDKTPNLGPA